jgi:hypothetical protein
MHVSNRLRGNWRLSDLLLLKHAMNSMGPKMASSPYLANVIPTQVPRSGTGVDTAITKAVVTIARWTWKGATTPNNESSDTVWALVLRSRPMQQQSAATMEHVLALSSTLQTSGFVAS